MSPKLLRTYICWVFIPIFVSGTGERPTQICHQDKLIKRCDNIVLVTVTSAKLVENGMVVYKFKVNETIKGAGIDVFSLRGNITFYEHDLRHFDHHSDPDFWSNNMSRVYVTYYEVIPSFVTGGRFLIFVDEPYHARSFERIPSPLTDKWLWYVKKKVKEQAAKQTPIRGAEGVSGSEEVNP